MYGNRSRQQEPMPLSIYGNASWQQEPMPLALLSRVSNACPPCHPESCCPLQEERLKTSSERQAAMIAKLEEKMEDVRAASHHAHLLRLCDGLTPRPSIAVQ